MDKFLFRITRPVPFAVVSCTALAAVLIDPVRGSYFGIFPVICMICNLICYLADWITKRRHGPDAVKDNLIECHVDGSTFDRLQQMADELGLSLQVFCSLCLEAVDPVELANARAQLTDDEACI